MVQIKQNETEQKLEQWSQWRKASSSIRLEWNEQERGRIMENGIREEEGLSSCGDILF